MRFRRSSGTLLHPTSLPTNFGIGDLGPSARTFIDFLEETSQSVWQILPLGPTGYGNSPYASYSAFAGNHYLLSPEVLKEKGLLTSGNLSRAIPMSYKVPYEKAFALKDDLLNKASERFYGDKFDEFESAFKTFKKENKEWLDDYVLFMACLEHFDKRPWNQWDDDIRKRTKKGLTKWKKKLKDRIDFHYFVQFEFANQWFAVKDYANERKIQVIGDIPIFVDHNSSDVWANSKYFAVDNNGYRTLVAGVPPDYFSATGQLWGNPLYKWDELQKDDFSWWVQRFEQMFTLYDAIRVDHFRGFDAYWEIQADAETAINGRWVKGPGPKLFDTIKKKLGELPIIAEDLGVLTESVVDLRDRYNFPGMKILQFAFNDNAANGFLPHNYDTANCVVYSGTHDNDTTRGWYNTGSDLEKHRVREYTRSDGSEISWELIRLGMMSVSDMAIFPMQDYLDLGTKHRMNYPGTSSGNWDWRYTPEMFDRVDRQRLSYLIHLTNRNPRIEHEDANLVDIEAAEA